jgi:hypothetical protein
MTDSLAQSTSITHTENVDIYLWQLAVGLFEKSNPYSEDPVEMAKKVAAIYKVLNAAHGEGKPTHFLYGYPESKSSY